MNVTPLSSAVLSAATASSSETLPQSAPIAQAPNPISEISRPSLAARREFICLPLRTRLCMTSCPVP